MSAGKVAWRTYLYLLRRLGEIKARNYDVGRTVVVSAHPRSGSTWLAEVLNTIPRSCVLWEPFNQKLAQVRALGLGVYPIIPPDSEGDWDELERLMQRVLSGQFLRPYTLSHAITHGGWLNLVGCQTWIVKFCRANGILYWLTTRFPVRPILLIRHPCAVVASKLVRFDWARQMDVTALARAWCKNYRSPLSAPRPHPWLLVTYEGLVRDGAGELGRIFDWLGIEMPRGAVARLSVPSATTSEGASVARGEDPLAEWQHQLTPGQTDQILRTAKSWGLDFYTDEIEPDHARLSEYVTG